MADDIPQRLCLGIDLGTTSVKTYLINSQTNHVIHLVSKPSHAEVESHIGVKGSEQNPHLILKTLKDCLETIPQEKQMLVDTLCVTGQMHGVMLWSRQSMKNDFSHQFDKINGNDSKVKTSHLYIYLARSEMLRGVFVLIAETRFPPSHSYRSWMCNIVVVT